jgi:hypothetical protein
MKLQDMRVSDAEKKAEAKICEPCCGDGGPDYPWGLALDLGKNELAKLGMAELPKIGDIIHLEAIAKVTSLYESASEGGEDSKNCTLQVMLLGCAPESQTKEQAAGKIFDGAGKRPATTPAY